MRQDKVSAQVSTIELYIPFAVSLSCPFFFIGVSVLHVCSDCLSHTTHDIIAGLPSRSTVFTTALGKLGDTTFLDSHNYTLQSSCEDALVHIHQITLLQKPLQGFYLV